MNKELDKHQSEWKTDTRYDQTSLLRDNNSRNNGVNGNHVRKEGNKNTSETTDTNTNTIIKSIEGINAKQPNHKRDWFFIIQQHAELTLHEEAPVYGGEQLLLQPGKLYFVVSGCVIVKAKSDHHILYLVRSRGCLNIERLIDEDYEYEYIKVDPARLLTVSVQSMHQMLVRYPKLMPRLLRHEHYILDQMLQFSLVYRDGCRSDDIKNLYDRLKPPFSYAVFEKHVKNDIL